MHLQQQVARVAAAHRPAGPPVVALDQAAHRRRVVGALEGGGRQAEQGVELRLIRVRHVHLERDAPEERLVHQLACLERGEPPDNRVNPKRLSHADGVLLREALHTVGRVQEELRVRYATDLLG